MHDEIARAVALLGLILATISFLLGLFNKQKKKVRLSRHVMRRGNNLYYRYQNLSDLWSDLAKILGHGGEGYNGDAKDAYHKAELYKRKTIALEEELLKKEELENDNS